MRKCLILIRRSIYKSPSLLFETSIWLTSLWLNIPSTYKEIIDNLNIRDISILKGEICAFCTKETELTNLGVIKEDNVYFATWKEFCEGQKGQRKAEVYIIAQIPNKSYTFQNYFLCLTINCFIARKIVINEDTILNTWPMRKKKDRRPVIKTNFRLLTVYYLILFKNWYHSL